TNAAVLHLALSTLPAKQRRALAAAAPALDALARAIDQLADRPAAAQGQGTDRPGKTPRRAGNGHNGRAGPPDTQGEPGSHVMVEAAGRPTATDGGRGFRRHRARCAV